MNQHYQKLADTLLRYSVKLKKNEKILIDTSEVPDEFVICLIRSVRSLGALPYVQQSQPLITRELLYGATEEQFKLASKWELARMKQMDAYLAIRGSQNIFENCDIPPKNMAAAMKALRPVLNHRVNKTRWVVLRWPTPSMAQQAMMSSETFQEFFFKVCTQDYQKMAQAMKPLQRLMEKTDRVHIKGPGTDLHFSIKDIPVIPCAGQYNIPDGEVFTAPVKNSVEGVITHNAPTVYQGVSFDNICLHFEKGKIVSATSSDNSKRLNQILDTDAGARYIGEFAIGVNPHILEPMRDILFDEKIAGSFHFTPGQAYEEADNSNRSQVHWDMVSIQRKDYGGGDIYFDDILIRRNGLFIPKSLQKLNPKELA